MAYYQKNIFYLSNTLLSSSYIYKCGLSFSAGPNYGYI